MHHLRWDDIEYLVKRSNTKKIQLLFSEKFYDIKISKDLKNLVDSLEWDNIKYRLKN
jgi:hypothetical protein